MKALLAIGLLAGCYQQYSPGPATPSWNPEPVTVSGPPGGEIDPSYSYEQPQAPQPQAPQDPAMPGYPNGYPQGGYPEGYPQGSEYGTTEPAEAPAAEPSSDPQNPNYVMGSVTDAEIDTTLQGYGEWVTNDEYGRVWRPYATVVGVNFTPYETCGSWVYTDYGWTYASCDEWAWGWLPFHYGQWDWFGDSWCWVPDYTWSPGWVDWRYGGGYTGWRPTQPHRGTVVRDHRNGSGGTLVVRDHRRNRDSDWHFVHDTDLGKANLRGLRQPTAQGLGVTTEVTRPPVKPSRPTATAASVMRNRLGNRAVATSGGVRPTRNWNNQPGFDQRAGGRYVRPQGYTQPTRGNPYRPDGTYRQPGYQANGGYQGGYQQPSRGYQQPSRGYQPTYQQPTRPTYQQPSRGYQPTYQQPSRPSYQQPSRGYQPTYQQPSRPSYQQPSRPSSSYSRPSSSSSYSRPSSSSSSYSRPSSSSSSHSSSSSSRSSSSSSHSSSSSSHSSSGGHSSGGHHR